MRILMCVKSDSDVSPSFPYAKERLRFANLAVHGILWRLEPSAITISRLAKEMPLEFY